MTHQQLRTARQEAGISMEEMARRLGMSRRTYEKWERGESPIPAIGVTAIRWLLSGVVTY